MTLSVKGRLHLITLALLYFTVTAFVTVQQLKDGGSLHRYTYEMERDIAELDAILYHDMYAGPISRDNIIDMTRTFQRLAEAGRDCKQLTGGAFAQLILRASDASSITPSCEAVERDARAAIAKLSASRATVRPDLADALKDDLSQLVDSVDAIDAPTDHLNNGIVFVGMTSIWLIGILTAAFVMASARSISRPLKRLEAVAAAYTQGDYSAEVPDQRRGDEIGKLARALKGFGLSIKERERLREEKRIQEEKRLSVEREAEENKRAYSATVREKDEFIHFQARHDAETGLPNRTAFKEMVSEKVSAGEPFTMMCVEVQDLMDIKSATNREQFIELMTEIGDRLMDMSGQTVARLLPELYAFCHDTVEDIEKLGHDFISGIKKPFHVGDLSIDIIPKIGIVSFPEDGGETEELMRHLSVALKQGRGAVAGYGLYQEENQASFQTRLTLMSDLRAALTSGEATYFYQPKLDLQTNEISGSEALIRWNSKDHGFVPPDEFIPMAEKTGDIRMLTLWGLRSAVRQGKAWEDAGLDISIAVNLSSKDVTDDSLPVVIERLLQEYDLSPNRLKLELTESAFMDNLSDALSVLNRINQMGIELSIDDFGTGYSSLSYIRQLPVQAIKIDKSFVTSLTHNSDDAILVKSTIDLSHNLGLKAIAEGVENEESLDILRDLGCDIAQGYHIGKPMLTHQFEGLVSKRKEPQPA